MAEHAAKLFAVLWAYDSVLRFIKDRSPSPHTPFSLKIDDVSSLVGSTGVNTDVLADELNELVNRIARCHALEQLTSRAAGRWRPFSHLVLALVDELAAD